MKTNSCLKPLLSLLLCAALWNAHAQTVLDLAQVRGKYPGEIGVFIEDRVDILIDYKGDSIITQENQRREMLYLTEQANEFSDEKIYYSYFSKLKDISAETLVPADKKYKKVKVTEFKDNREYSSGIFYDDLMSKSFMFPAVQPGARTVLNYSREIIDPRFLTSFYFGAGIPMERAEINITVNKNIKLNYKLFNTEAIDIKHSTQAKGDFITHTFSAENLKGFPYQENAPSAGYYRPHIVYYLEASSKSDKQKPILGGLDDLHDWYYTFIDDVIESKDSMEELRLVVDSLMLGTTDELEKVKKIYYWVQDHINYVAIENGYRGFIPHSAMHVFKKRYGDCKDMATIIYSMLKIAGIPSYLTWIGSRDIPYKYSELPSPVVDNHMITTYLRGEETYFLDATSKYTKFGQPASHIQGKEALISIDSKKYLIRQVPIVDAEENRIVDTTFLTIQDKMLHVRGNILMNSYPKIFTTYRLAGLSYKKQKEYLTAYLMRGNNKFLLDTVTVQNLTDRDKPLVIDFRGTVGDYVKMIDGEIYINLNLDKIYFNDLIDTARRKAPRENIYCYEADMITVLEIPQGYALESLPENVSSKHDLFSFTITYEKDKANRIICSRSVTVNHLLLEKNDFKEWNNMVERLSAAYRDVVILKTL